MFEAKFVLRCGVRILRIEYSNLSATELATAADQVQRIMAAEPLGSVRALTLLSSNLTADGAATFRRCALANKPHIRASAMVCSSFWKVIAADVQARGREELKLVMHERRERPLLLIDIAVPRDIDPGCGGLEGASLYDIDDLQAVVARNLDTRAGEIPGAHEIIEEEIRRFARWLGQLDALPTVSALREHGNALVEQVLAENAGRWESASPRDQARVEAIARAVMSRLLHEPTIRLRSLAGDRSHAGLELVRELFGLNADAPLEQPPSGELAEVHDLQSRRGGSAGRAPG